MGLRHLAFAAAALALVACARDPEHTFTRPPLDGAVFADTTAELSPLLYRDGSKTLNDRCPVRRVRLNRRMPPLYVNQRPVGFC